jgi:hypothetical protein
MLGSRAPHITSMSQKPAFCTRHKNFDFIPPVCSVLWSFVDDLFLISHSIEFISLFDSTVLYLNFSMGPFNYVRECWKFSTQHPSRCLHTLRFRFSAITAHNFAFTWLLQVLRSHNHLHESSSEMTHAANKVQSESNDPSLPLPNNFALPQVFVFCFWAGVDGLDTQKKTWLSTRRRVDVFPVGERLIGVRNRDSFPVRLSFVPISFSLDFYFSFPHFVFFSLLYSYFPLFKSNEFGRSFPDLATQPVPQAFVFVRLSSKSLDLLPPHPHHRSRT